MFIASHPTDPSAAFKVSPMYGLLLVRETLNGREINSDVYTVDQAHALTGISIEHLHALQGAELTAN